MKINHKQKWIEQEYSNMRWYRHRFLEFIYWNLPFGEIVTIKWPTGNNPDDIWRPWLEKNLGRQGYKWDWRMSRLEVDSIDIKFLNLKMASYFILANATFLSK